MNMKNSFLNNRELKNASWIILGKIIQIVITFFVTMFVIRYLGPANYGKLNYASAYVAFFSSLCTLGINSVIIKFFADSPHNHGEIIGTTIGLRVISSSISYFLIVCIVAFVNRGEEDIISITALCSVALIFQTFDTINYWFQSNYNSKVTSMVLLMAYIGTAIYNVVLLFLHKGIYWFAFATSVNYIVIAFLLYHTYKIHGGQELKFSLAVGKKILRSSYHYILSGMMVAVYGYTDRLMLKNMVDNETLGYYSLAASISTMWVFLLMAVIDSVYPTIINLFRKDKIAFEKKNRQLYAIVIYSSFTVALLLTFSGEFFITLIYGAAYKLANEPLKITVWYVAFSYLGVARNAWIVCNGYQKYLKYMYFGAAVINVFLNYLFIPLMGASGAAFASLITQIFTSMILPSFIKDMRPNVKLMIDAFMLKNLK